MKIKIIMPYHQNIYDTMVALGKEHDVELLSPEIGRDIPKDINCTAVRSRAISKKIGRIFSFSELWKKITKDTDCVIVKHVEQPSNFFIYLICKIKGIKCVINVQKFQRPNSLIYRFLLKALTLFLGSNTRVFAVTKKGAWWAGKYFRHAIYIPICINPKRFSERKQSAKKSDTINLICVSKYQKRKNLPHLIEALRQLVEKYSDTKFKLKIIGTAFTKGKISKYIVKEKKVYGEIVQLIKDKKLGGNVELLKDLDYNKMNRVYAQSDIFIFPASKEPLGYALVEAMACGLPVLCTSEVGAKCYIKGGKSGWIFKSRNADEIVSYVEKFIAKGKPNWKKINEFGRKNREIIKKEHSPAAFMTKFKKLLEK